MATDPTNRFSERVEAYIRYRPGYPDELYDHLEDGCRFTRPAVVADIGAGTGILSRGWLERGHRVLAVEPNEPMRRAAQRLLGEFDGFSICDGTAEATSLPPASADLVTAAQSFHWFDPAPTRREFHRVLQPGGWVALIWNDRRKSSSPFHTALDELLLKHGTDYRQVDHTQIGDAVLSRFFGPEGYEQASFDNHQTLDFQGLRGRLDSSSYVPSPDSPAHTSMLEDLRRLFDAHQQQGTVQIDYDTRLYFGRLT